MCDIFAILSMTTINLHQTQILYSEFELFITAYTERKSIKFMLPRLTL